MIRNPDAVALSRFTPTRVTTSLSSTSPAERLASKAFPCRRPPQSEPRKRKRPAAILKARPIFVGQVNGQTEVNRSRYEEFRKLLDAESPDVVFTHWPIDSHSDHRVASLLAYDAWLEGGKKFDLYYYEVDQGCRRRSFTPPTMSILPSP